MAFSGTTMILLGISQATFVFALATVFLFLFNRKLKKRAHALAERLDAQSKLHKKTINTLKDKLDARPPPPAPSVETVEVPGGEYSAFLNRNIEQTEQRLVALGAEPNAQFQPDDSAEIIAARMRHAFLESEKLVLAFSTDPELMWETLQPNIDRITIGLRRHNAALMSEESHGGNGRDGEAQNHGLQEKLKTLESRWLKLETLAQSSLDALDDNYVNLTLALASQSADNRIHEQTDALANRFLEILNQITAENYPQKDYQMQLATAGSDLVSPSQAGAEFPPMEAPLPDEEPTQAPDIQPSQSSTSDAQADIDAIMDAEIDALADALVESVTDSTADTRTNDILDSDIDDDINELDLSAELASASEPSTESQPAENSETNVERLDAEAAPEPESNAKSQSDALAEDIDAILAETSALLDDDESSDDELNPDEIINSAQANQEDEDDDEDDMFSASSSEFDALDEEFSALAGENLSDPKDLNPDLLTDDDDIADLLNSTEKTTLEGSEPTSDALNELDASASSIEADDDELDPDAIIAAALAETENATEADNNESTNFMDEATFEDLLADSGVDLHGDIDKK